jgi:hypothetical protein
VADCTTKEISGSGNSQGSKPKKTSFQIQQLIDKIGKMLSEGKLDREIMQELQIKRSQYYEYKSKLFQFCGFNFLILYFTLIGFLSLKRVLAL